jgi:hypothetical protein
MVIGIVRIIGGVTHRVATGASGARKSGADQRWSK